MVADVADATASLKGCGRHPDSVRLYVCLLQLFPVDLLGLRAAHRVVAEGLHHVALVDVHVLVVGCTENKL